MGITDVNPCYYRHCVCLNLYQMIVSDLSICQTSNRIISVAEQAINSSASGVLSDLRSAPYYLFARPGSWRCPGQDKGILFEMIDGGPSAPPAAIWQHFAALPVARLANALITSLLSAHRENSLAISPQSHVKIPPIRPIYTAILHLRLQSLHEGTMINENKCH